MHARVTLDTSLTLLAAVCLFATTNAASKELVLERTNACATRFTNPQQRVAAVQSARKTATIKVCAAH